MFLFFLDLTRRHAWIQAVFSSLGLYAYLRVDIFSLPSRLLSRWLQREGKRSQIATSNTGSARTHDRGPMGELQCLR